MGIALGSWWAYYELGWGGYWFWDPVENASFMPWLVGTALIHSLAATEKRGLFKSWTLLLAILAFSPELVRHVPGAFGRAGRRCIRSRPIPTRGMFILAFLVIVIGGALTLYAWRAPLLKSPAGFEGTAREAFLLYNNILLVVAAAMVFVGTLAPLIADALEHARRSRWARRTSRSLFPLLMLPLVALVSIGIHAAWKRGQLGNAAQAHRCWASASRWSLGLAIVFGVYGPGKLLTPIGMVLGIWIILSSLFDPIDRLRRRLTLPRAIIGMTIAHIGLGVCVIADLDRGVVHRRARRGASRRAKRVALGRYAYRFDSIKEIEGPNYDGVRAEVTVLRDGQPIAVLHPEKRNYWVQRSTHDRGRHRTAAGTWTCSWRWARTWAQGAGACARSCGR